jgi:hypothetical protein
MPKVTQSLSGRVSIWIEAVCPGLDCHLEKWYGRLSPVLLLSAQLAPPGRVGREQRASWEQLSEWQLAWLLCPWERAQCGSRWVFIST